jgi:hypothetical protein
MFFNKQFPATLVTVFCSLILIYSCDSAEDDVSPANPRIEISDAPIFTLASGKAYIDLYSIVKSSAKINVSVSSKPQRGSLAEVAPGLLRYAPSSTFKSGSDSFIFSIYSETKQLLKTDTVDVIVKDSTNLPCGFYPNDDWIYTAGTPVEVDVLENDYLCGDTSDLVVQVYRPGNSFPPFLGTATIVDGNKIRYVANDQSAHVVDTVVYKVYKSSNTSVVGYGTLYIDANSSCVVEVNDNSYDLQQPGPGTDTLTLAVLLDDNFCGKPFDSLVIAKNARRTTAMTAGTYIKYPFTLSESQKVIMDSLTYRVCDGDQCLDAKVRIKLFY